MGYYSCTHRLALTFNILLNLSRFLLRVPCYRRKKSRKVFITSYTRSQRRRTNPSWQLTHLLGHRGQEAAQTILSTNLLDHHLDPLINPHSTRQPEHQKENRREGPFKVHSKPIRSPSGSPLWADTLDHAVHGPLSGLEARFLILV